MTWLRPASFRWRSTTRASAGSSSTNNSRMLLISISLVLIGALLTRVAGWERVARPYPAAATAVISAADGNSLESGQSCRRGRCASHIGLAGLRLDPTGVQISPPFLSRLRRRPIPCRGHMTNLVARLQRAAPGAAPIRCSSGIRRPRCCSARDGVIAHANAAAQQLLLPVALARRRAAGGILSRGCDTARRLARAHLSAARRRAAPRWQHLQCARAGGAPPSLARRCCSPRSRISRSSSTRSMPRTRNSNH